MLSLVLPLVSKLDDPHNVVVLQLALEVAGRPDVILDLTKSGRALSLITLFFCFFSSLFLFFVYMLSIISEERTNKCLEWSFGRDSRTRSPFKDTHILIFFL